MANLIVSTGDSNRTEYYEGEERVYPCRCGQVHRSPNLSCWLEHECDHKAPLYGLDVGEYNGKDQIRALCPECGKTFLVDYSDIAEFTVELEKQLEKYRNEQ